MGWADMLKPKSHDGWAERKPVESNDKSTNVWNAAKAFNSSHPEFYVMVTEFDLDYIRVSIRDKQNLDKKLGFVEYAKTNRDPGYVLVFRIVPEIKNRLTFKDFIPIIGAMEDQVK